jgi:hypothetical protein
MKKFKSIMPLILVGVIFAGSFILFSPQKAIGSSEVFLPLNQASRSWFGISVDSSNQNVYAVDYGADIYKQTGGVSNFAALNQIAREWRSISVDSSNQNVYAVDASLNSDIYKQMAGGGDFIALGQPFGYFYGIISVDSSNQNVYATNWSGMIYKQTGGVGNFVALDRISRNWTGISVDSSNHNVYAVVNYGDIYKQTGGIGDFAALGQSSRWTGISVDSSNHNVYATTMGNDSHAADIYKMTYSNGDSTTLLPDLTAGDLSPTTAIVDTPLSFYATISNIGNASTEIGFNNLFQITDRMRMFVELSPVFVPAIVAGGTGVAISPSYTFNSGGTYYARVCADKSSAEDANGTIVESPPPENENNNCGVWTKVIVSLPASVNITANNQTDSVAIPYGGFADLRWSYSNASFCTITPPASIGQDQSSYPTGIGGPVSTGILYEDRIYTISCKPPERNPVVKNILVDVADPPKELNVIKLGQGTITSGDLPGINCGPGCSRQSAEFPPGTKVTLTANTYYGRIFIGWKGVYCEEGSQNSSTCTFNMSGNDITVIANFALVRPIFRDF